MRINQQYKSDQKEIYKKHLTDLLGVKFTAREVDILSCLLHNRGEKKIAALLSLSPRTVGTHIRNIMFKLNCNSREQIIDFVERSGKYQYVWQYYFQLLTRNLFEKQLEKVKSLFFRQPITGIIDNIKSTDEEKILLSKLREDLKSANVILHEEQERNLEGKFSLSILTGDSLPLKNNADTIYLLVNKTISQIASQIEYCDFREEKNYYFAILDLLKKIINKPEADKLFDEFSEEYKKANTLVEDREIVKNEEIEEKQNNLNLKQILILIAIIAAFITTVIKVISTQYSLQNQNNQPSFSENTKTGKSAIISNLIEPAKYYVNHAAELENLSNSLGLYKKAGLLGISGIGKTQLARMYVYKNHDKYNLIWFFDCSIDMSEQFVQLAKQINKFVSNESQITLQEDFKSAKKSVINYLTSQKGWLLVFDNLRVNQNSKLHDIINWEHNGHIIICSQDNKNLNEAIQLPHLNKEDSINLANTILEKSDHELVEELVETFKGYPLLVVRGAMFLKNNPHMTLAEYRKVMDRTDNQARAHIELVLANLNDNAKDLLYKITLLGNKFSKIFLSKINKNKDSFAEDLLSLIRFGLITHISESDKSQLFEIHDMIRSTIFETMDVKVVKSYLNQIIEKLNSLMPQSFSLIDRYIFISEDEAIKNNIEAILENADQYNAEIHKVLELSKNLMDYYLSIKDYNNCERLAEWLRKQESSQKIKLSQMSDEEKSAYSYYLAVIGTYEDFAKANFGEAIAYYKKAEEIMNKVPNYIRTKTTIYFQLAQTLLSIGEIENAQKSIAILDDIINRELIPNNPKVMEAGRIWFLKAKLYLAQGNYKLALEAINKHIAAEPEQVAKNTVSSSMFITKANILNYMQNYKEAKGTAEKVYKQEIKNIKSKHIIHARALIELSRAENGIGHNFSKALEYAKEAKEILLQDKLRTNSDINTSKDSYLAMALVAEGDAHFNLGNLEQAVDLCNIAERIYFNKYKENMKYIDEVSYLYWAAARAACKLVDKTWYSNFSSKHIRLFGENHPRSVIISNMGCNNVSTKPSK